MIYYVTRNAETIQLVSFKDYTADIIMLDNQHETARIEVHRGILDEKVIKSHPCIETNQPVHVVCTGLIHQLCDILES